MNEKRLLVGLLLVVVALLAGCALGNLFFAPIDLVRAVGRGPRLAEPAEQAGPVEAALHRAARETGQTGLLVDTVRPEDDLKQLARRCDQGDEPACGRLGTPFVFFLEERALGIRLWERACDAGSAHSCRVLADFLARAYLPEHDAARAAALYQRGCRLEAPDRRACWQAAQPYQGERDDLFFYYADRACEAGTGDACRELVALCAKRDPQLAEYYETRKPFPSLARAKRALERVLVKEKFAGQTRQVLGEIVPRRLFQLQALENCRRMAARVPRVSCEIYERPLRLGPVRWEPAGEVATRCLACQSQCPPASGYDDRARRRCFCQCAADAGGCGLDAGFLADCVDHYRDSQRARGAPARRGP